MNISDDYLTVAGSQWVEPLADLVNSWHQSMLAKPSDYHITTSNRGRCHAIILLLLVMFESYSQRAAFDMANGDSLTLKRFYSLEWWEEFTNYAEKEEVLDALILRNIIAHNHLYSYSLNPDNTVSARFRAIRLNDNQLKKRTKNGLFLCSGMSCVPDLIGANDLLIVSRIIKKAMEFLKGMSTHIGSTEFTFVRAAGAKSLWTGLEIVSKMAIERVGLATNDYLT